MSALPQKDSPAQVIPSIQVQFDDGKKTQKIVLKKSRWIVGSLSSADIRVDHASVSPIHAVIEVDGTEKFPRLKVLDLASDHGVFVNGVRTVHQPFLVTDRIRVGSVDISFILNPKKPKPELPDSALLLVDENETTAIFDFRPPHKEALEVVYSWNKTILSVDHFLEKKTLTLGEDQTSDFLIPPVPGLSAGLPWIEEVSTGVWSVKIHDAMSGLAYIGGEVIDVSQKRGTSLRLGSDDFVKITFLGFAFYISQTVAPPVLVKKGDLWSDPFLLKSMLGSVVATLLIGFAVAKLDQGQTIEAQVLPERVATILYHPEKYGVKRPPQPKPKPQEEKKPVAEKPKPVEVDFTKPKPVEKKEAQKKSSAPGKKALAQNQAKQGEGARAKGAAGKRGSPQSQVKGKPQLAASRPSPDAGKDRGGTPSAGQDNGNLQKIKGASSKILDLLGGAGEKLGKSGDKLQGFGGFTTAGSGGAALSGGGKGGGGNADTLLGGLGDKGRGGGRVGTGLGADGTGAGIVGGKTRIELRAGGGEETVVMGSIDREAIDAAA